MFIVFGILSILAGCFIFLQSAFMSFMSSLADTSYEITGIFTIVGLSLIVAGAMNIASYDGKRKRFVYGSLISYIIAFLPGITNFTIGDMPIWTVASGIMIAVNTFWLIFYRDKTENFIDPKMIKKVDRD